MSLSEFPKEIAWRIKRDPNRVDNIKSWKNPQERLSKLSEETWTLNITKWTLPEVEQEIWKDWILRLIYLVQNSIDIWLWLCKWFRIFQSRRNHKYHKICLFTMAKCKAQCDWILKKCNKWFFDNNWERQKEPEKSIKRIKFNKL